MISYLELELQVEFDYTPAGGDGWNEPRYDEEVAITAVKLMIEGGNGAFIDLLPALTKKEVEQLEQEAIDSMAD